MDMSILRCFKLKYRVGHFFKLVSTHVITGARQSFLHVLYVHAIFLLIFVLCSSLSWIGLAIKALL